MAAVVAAAALAAATTAGGTGRVGAVGSGWQAFLARSRDLGRDTGPVQFLVDLRRDPDTQRLRQWASDHDLQEQVLAGLATAVIGGNARLVGAALGVRIDNFRAPGGQEFYASRGLPRTPAALRGEVSEIGRITSYGPMESHITWPAASLRAAGLNASDLLDVYGARPLMAGGYTGAGQTIVFFESDGYRQSDLNEYAARNRLPPFTVAIVGSNPGSGTETPMDLEVAHGIADGARLVYLNILSIRATNPAVAWELAFSTAAADYPGAIWSISLGICERAFNAADLDAINKAVSAAESRGTSVFAASGDAGGNECAGAVGPDQGVSMPADLPAVTGVGGTTLKVSPPGTYVGETTWSLPLLSQGSGGGVSSFFGRPVWQSAPGVAGATGVQSPCFDSSGCRDVPDVSADADPSTGAQIVENGTAYLGGGTSQATPIWAGLMALIDAYLRGHRKPMVGFANPWLYRLARGAPLLPVHDITIGGNNYFAAGPGYDAVTGLGSPRAWNLARDLAAAGA